MRRDEQRLLDIVEAAESLGRMLSGRNESDFLGDETLRFAVVQRLVVIGEAAARVSNALQESYASIPWADIVAFRNVLVHEYFGVHWPIVWLTATERVPDLARQIGEIMRREFPESVD